LKKLDRVIGSFGEVERHKDYIESKRLRCVDIVQKVAVELVLDSVEKLRDLF
jgi:hypothetical protein